MKFMNKDGILVVMEETPLQKGIKKHAHPKKIARIGLATGLIYGLIRFLLEHDSTELVLSFYQLLEQIGIGHYVEDAFITTGRSLPY